MAFVARTGGHGRARVAHRHPARDWGRAVLRIHHEHAGAGRGAGGALDRTGRVTAGAVVTVLPLLVVGVAARLVRRLDYVRLCGLVAGSMTDPPAPPSGTRSSAATSPRRRTRPSTRSR